MAINAARSESQPLSEMNTTPLIDVMLVLLIMFVITVPVMTHAVKLDLRQSTRLPPSVTPQVVDLEVEFDGTVVWNGTVVPSFEVLEAYLRSASGQDMQPEIHLRPDSRAKYGDVAVVLASAQRHHLKKIGFVNTAEFGD
jgi:biopolymer transport protein ExbD